MDFSCAEGKFEFYLQLYLRTDLGACEIPRDRDSSSMTFRTKGPCNKQLSTVATIGIFSDRHPHDQAGSSDAGSWASIARIQISIDIDID